MKTSSSLKTFDRGKKSSTLSKTQVPAREALALTKVVTTTALVHDPSCWEEEDAHFLSFVIDEEAIRFPRRLLYQEYNCVHFKKIIDLHHWILNGRVFALLHPSSAANLYTLNLDSTAGWTVSDLQSIRGHPSLKRLSIAKSCHVIDKPFAEVLSSLPQLLHLNLSHNTFDSGVLSVFSTSCKTLKSLDISYCLGIDNYALHALGSLFERFRSLESIQLAGCLQFTDEGLLELVQAGLNLLVDLNISGCQQLSTLCLAGLRSKMSKLSKLQIDRLNVGITTFEWISEGCKQLTYLDVTKSGELTDSNLVKIGRWCRFLKTLLISRCKRVTDSGISEFFECFSGQLERIDITECLQCGELSMFAIANSSSKDTLQDVRCNGLSQISTESLTCLFTQAPLLRHFELCAELRSSSSHRKSMMPHMSDDVLTTARYSAIQTLRVVGSFLVTDVGIAALVRQCKDSLRHLDVSYCSNVTDRSLGLLGQHATRLETLLAKGCVKITSLGVIALTAKRCAQTLLHFEANGCEKLHDDAVRALARCPNLQSVSLRSCDHITESPLREFFSNCRSLTSVDIQGLDLISTIPIAELFTNAIELTALDCEECNFTLQEFQAVVRRLQPPFGQSAPTKCQLTSRSQRILQHNRFVLAVRKANAASFVLQRFFKAVKTAKLLKVTRLLQKQRQVYLKKVFVAFRVAVFQDSKMEKRQFRLEAVKTLQRLLPQIYSIHCARKKLFVLRREDYARRLIQRTFRGFASRKRSRKRILKRRKAYSQFVRISLLYMLLAPFRLAQRSLHTLQAFVRMIPWRIRYRVLYKMIVRCQQRFRLRRLFQRRKRILDAEKAVAFRMESERRNVAARFIQKNWKNRLFNSAMAPYIFFCCIYYRNEYDEQVWCATKMQKVFRGFRVRYAQYLENTRADREWRSAIVIQKIWRGVEAYRRMQAPRARFRALCKRMALLLVRSKPRLRLGVYCKRIQHMFRMHRFREERRRAASSIQRTFHRQFVHWHWKEARQEKQLRCALRVQRGARRWLARMHRKEMRNRQHMAAFRIFLSVDKFFKVQRIMQGHRDKEKEERERVNELKRQRVLEKRSLIFQNIKERYRQVMARRIQKAFRKHKAIRDKLERSMSSKSQFSFDDSLESVAEPTLLSKMTNTILSPFRAVKDGADRLATMFSPQDKIDPSDQPKLENAVLKYQLKSIIQEGIVEMHITAGELEYKSFNSLQTNRAKVGLPSFKQIPHDLSGDLGLHIHLWMLFGKGEEVICQIKVQPRPDHTSNAAMKMRAQSLLEHQHTQLIWHHNLNFEILGERSLQQGLADFAIREITLTADIEEELLLREKEYRLLCDFVNFGFPKLTMWCISNKLEDEDILFKFSRLTANYWCDERLLRTVKGFNLSEDDVGKLRVCFERILMGRNKETLRTDEIFHFIDFPFNSIAKWSILAIKPDRKREITFSEFVHYVSYFIMLSAKDLTRFLFQHADTENNCYLRREQFNSLLEVLAEGSPFNIKGWEYQFHQYHDKKLTFQFIKHFEDFVKQNPGVLWQPQLLQLKLMKLTLGKQYWDTKAEQYRLVREQMHITLR